MTEPDERREQAKAMREALFGTPEPPADSTPAEQARPGPSVPAEGGNPRASTSAPQDMRAFVRQLFDRN